MREQDFDAMLQANVPELPPDDVVSDVTPWRKAMNRVLFGLALTMVTLNVWGLNYILPTIGLVLSLWGFRTLHRENGWFKSCYLLTIIHTASFLPTLILNATIYQSAAYSSSPFQILSGMILALNFARIFCLWQGFRAVQRKAGLPEHAGGGAALMVWYVLLGVLAQLQYEGGIIPIALIVAYICILRSLFKLSKELDEAGYAIQTAPVRVPDWVLAAGIAALLLIGLTCAFLFANRYPMAWAPVERTESEQADAIRENLIALGFPEAILDDLTEDDLMDCAGAQRIVVQTSEHSVHNEASPDHTILQAQPDELRHTGIAVQLPGEPERWKLFHHFQWMVNPGFYGTECFQLQPAYSASSGWSAAGDVSGQVLYDRDGRIFAAPYDSLGSETYTSDSVFFGTKTATDIFAAFSLPGAGENQRGYISYTIQKAQIDVSVIVSIANYTHQHTWLQYPAITAKAARMAGWWTNGPFLTMQGELQYWQNEELP